MILDSELFDHLRSMALFGIDVNDVEVEVTTQMAWSSEKTMTLSGEQGHEFVPAPKSMRFRKVRADGGRDLLLLLEHKLEPGTPAIDHLQKLHWVYAGPSGVFSPKQVAAFWAGLCTGYEGVTGSRPPYSERFSERDPAEISSRSASMTINLGRLIAYLKISREIFELDMEGEPSGDLMFQRTRLQALYEKHSCDRAEFDAVCAARLVDPISRACFGLDSYFAYYANSRSMLDPQTGMREFREEIKNRLAIGVRAAAENGLGRDRIAEFLGEKVGLHMLHQQVMVDFVDDVLEHQVDQEQPGRPERQVA